MIAQDPKGGTSIVEGSDVRLNVSKGPQQTGLPNVVGRSFDDAAAALRESGFTPVRRDVEASEPEGTVVGMSPRAGSLAPPGTRVTLNVSTGQSTTAVPDVVGEEEASARATLQNEGWRVLIRDTPTDESRRGRGRDHADAATGRAGRARLAGDHLRRPLPGDRAAAASA